MNFTSFKQVVEHLAHLVFRDIVQQMRDTKRRDRHPRLDITGQGVSIYNDGFEDLNIKMC